MSTIFYRNPRLLVVTLLLVVVAGLSAYQVLPRMEDPRFSNRNAVVVTRLPGANAERVEALVTEKIEDELETIDEIRELASSSRAGASVIQIELDDLVLPDEVDEIWSRVRDKLNDVEPDLPREASKPDFNNDETFAYTLITALVWDSEAPVSMGILNRLAEQLEDELRAVSGTEYTDLFGGAEEEIRVDVDPAELAALGLTAADLAAAVQRSDAKVTAGLLRSGVSDTLIEVTGEVNNLDRVAGISIQFDDQGGFVRLGDVARVSRTIADPPAELALIDGKRAVTVAARAQPDRRIDHWSAAARNVVRDFASDLSNGVEVRVIFDQSSYVEGRLARLTGNFFLAVLAVMLVILLLMGWRSALLVGAALPLSALMVLAGMNYLRIPIHQMSVTGLIVALGLLIDNAIVVVDEINGRLNRGVSRLEAIGGSVRHLAVPLLGSTATTVLAFMPLVLMPGSPGEFVGTIAVSVILAVVSSLFLSLTVIPALAGFLNRAGVRASREDRPRGGSPRRMIADLYRRGLGVITARPALGIALAMALPVLGFVKSRELVEQFFPPADRDQFQLQVRLPEQASLAQTTDLVTRARGMLMEHPQVSDVHWFVGDSAPMYYYNLFATAEDDSPYFAQALVQMTTTRGGTEVIREVQRRLERAMPQAQVLALQLEQGPPFPAPIELKIFGPDLDRLRVLGDEARRVLADVPEVIASRTTLTDGRPKLWVQLDEQEARLAGLDNLEVAAQLDASLEGAVGGSMLEATEELPVRVRLTDGHRRDVAGMSSVDLYAPTASVGSGVESVPLAALGRVELRPELATIDRENGRRVNRILGNIAAGVLPGKVLPDYQARLQRAGFMETLPSGYSIEWGGEAGERDRAVGNLMTSVALLMVLMATTLVLSFGSFRLAGVIAVVAVASIGLGLGSLWVFGYPFGFMAIVGTMGLIGVAINDSIVVLAALRGDEAARRGDPAAVRDVVIRATRHVLATTLTTVAGFLPLIISGGGFWPPLAVSIAGGVVGATLLALTFVPSAYLLLMRGSAGRLSAAVTTAAGHEPASPALTATA